MGATRRRARLRGPWGCGVTALCLGWLVVVATAWGAAWPYLSRDARGFVAPLILATWAATLLPTAMAATWAVVVVRSPNRLVRATVAVGVTGATFVVAGTGTALAVYLLLT